MKHLLWLATLAACSNTSGTITLGLTTAPGSHVLDPVTRLRVTVTHPHAVFETDRTSTGFDLSLDVDATGEDGALIVEGFDADGTLIATGQSPTFSVAAINAKIVIYVAAPMSIAPAPVALAPARTELATTPLSYGAIFAGGRDAAGAPSTALAIYNAYDHSLTDGMPMPIGRAGMSLGINTIGGVYMFGGATADGAASGLLLRFDTTIAPNGAYVVVSTDPALARSGQVAVRTGTDRYLVSGTPPVSLIGGTLTARDDRPALPPVATSVTPPDGIPTAVFVSDTEIIRFRNDLFDVIGAGRDRASVTALPGGKIAIVGGGTLATARDIVVVDASTGTVTTIASALGTARFSPAVSATARHLVIAGGVDDAGAPIATAEILDATTLAPLAVIPVEPRAGTFAIWLPSDQVMIAGGTPATDLLELFTPPPPP